MLVEERVMQRENCDLAGTKTWTAPHGVLHGVWLSELAPQGAELARALFPGIHRAQDGLPGKGVPLGQAVSVAKGHLQVAESWRPLADGWSTRSSLKGDLGGTSLWASQSSSTSPCG